MLLLILNLVLSNSENYNYLDHKIQDNYFNYYNNHLGYNDNYTLEEIQNMSYILHNNNTFRRRKDSEIKINSIDYRNLNGRSFLPEIEDQGHCGSCVAYTVNYYIESLYLIKKDKIIDLSENDLFFCEGERTCIQGWNIGHASYVAKNKGVRLKDYCEYNIPINKCYENINNINNRKNMVIKIKNYIFLNNINHIKNWLINNSPVMSRLNVYSDLFSYNGGIYTKKSNNYIADHSVLVVGFNDREEYWIGMNSWGKHWGEEGYFRIKYGESGILPYAYVFTI
jgi:C1A family cysteine protease